MKLKQLLTNPYKVLLIIYAFFIVFALIVDTPERILQGLITIVQSQDILITDYIEIAGIGATLVNSALCNMISVAFLMRNKVKPTGATLMTFWLLAGFSFFGKNIFNIWPVILGGFLYAKYRREPFIKYYVVTMLATTLSPAVSQVAFDESTSLIVGLCLGVAIGAFIGFIMAPISENAVNSHHGYNLYNVGFAGGIVGILLRVILQAVGIKVRPVFIWNKGSSFILGIFLCILFVFLIFVGLYCGKNNRENLREILKRNGQSGSDFYLDYGESCYINMGILGLFATLVTVLMRVDLNGPTMGGIFTVAGFGCFGKHLKNIVPIMAGCMLGGMLIYVNNQTPSIALAVLFGTCLAPIAGTFGWKWGIVAGFLHVNLSMNLGEFHGGMNLYNNGLAGGLVVMFLLPLINALRRPPADKEEQILDELEM